MIQEILILEDDPARMLKFFRALSRKANLTFVETSRNAIQELQEHIFDWTYLDYDLGGRILANAIEDTGYEVALWLREHPERMPKNVIIHSLDFDGAKRMNQALPQAQIVPAAWYNL